MIDSATPSDEDLTRLLGRFIDESLLVLRRQHVLPRPRHQPWIEVGRDYFGPDLSGSAAFEALAEAIEATDDRFSEETPLHERDFANGYVFDALEFFVAQLTKGAPDPLSSTAVAVKEGLALPRTRVSAWMVTDIMTASEKAEEIAGVVVHPASEVGAGTRSAMLRLLGDVFGVRAERVDFDRLHSSFDDAALLVASYDQATSRADDLETPPSTRRIGDFVLATRLLFAATAHPIYELRGHRNAVGGHRPYIHEFEGAGQGSMSAGLDARRAAKLDASHEVGILEVLRSVRSVLDGPPSALQTAIGRYQLSHQKYRWVDKIIDLAIALEAALAGKQSSGVTYRLQVRAGALLASDADPAGALFDDIKVLYDLRSRFVHGGALSSRTIEKKLAKLHRVPPGDHFHRFRSDAVIDRFRDIVRRAILCRVLLAEHAPGLWEVGGDLDDSELVGDDSDAPWRSVWRQVLVDLGQPQAADAAPVLRGLGTKTADSSSAD